ncbi:Osmotin, thaumatin-like protein [Dissoconium aciculare CBS 342.82]|uniref:Osmotin, thaumatin-like protein n=1 Tax=Dissoconium aciculare CBS 342.82 TaxID=1314786 RepID=A0A6J3LWR9_9PEZI|nr:Osmotin, thaumatin-like protein [Dissoconium aciculare CBS 342.82]KAF1819744.1 Osmotin, thaumatin-like protein [Dissoconium aciculare CBS 342.82]
MMAMLSTQRSLAEHHMSRPVVSRQNSGSDVSLTISNWCAETIWPGIVTQGGHGPTATGFELSPRANRTLQVGGDWQGRVWGRTNCTFNSGQNKASCTTGECGQLVCHQAGNPPATLAEFTMNGGQSQTFYDISLVDGYNLPMAIVLLPNGGSTSSGSASNPSCVGSLQGFVASSSYNPYSNGQVFLGTTSSDPLPFDKEVTASSLSSWCPWDLQVAPPLAPGDGVYPYPETNIQRPAFAPCLSACAKYNSPQYCCTGQYDGPHKCAANYYAKAAKDICPDAYSYAYDDQDSTFIVPTGDSFQVIFCPGGRSTNIIASK